MNHPKEPRFQDSRARARPAEDPGTHQPPQGGASSGNPTGKEPDSSRASRHEKRSGRAGVDERGNAVWEWQIETGVYSRDPSTVTLRQLESSDLSLAHTVRNKRLEQEPPTRAAPTAPVPDASMAGGGFNPYDSAGGGGSNTFRPSKATSGSPRVPARQPLDLRKFDAWVKLKRRMQGRQD